MRPPLAPLGEPLAQRIYAAPLVSRQPSDRPGRSVIRACSQIIPTDAFVQFRIGLRVASVRIDTRPRAASSVEGRRDKLSRIDCCEDMNQR
jgi:hypothetical protein